jgi:hypothetical protein
MASGEHQPVLSAIIIYPADGSIHRDRPLYVAGLRADTICRQAHLTSALAEHRGCRA